MTLRVRYWDDVLDPWCWVASVRRERATRGLGPRPVFERRAFLAPARGVGAVFDDDAIAAWTAAAAAEPALGIATPERGAPYPSSGLPAQLVALRVRERFPERLRSLENRLFHAAFVRLEDVSDHAILARCVAAAGIPEAEVARAFEQAGHQELAKREHEEALALGITRVPALAVPGQPPLVGPQSEEAIRHVLLRGLAPAQLPERNDVERKLGQRMPRAG